MPSRRSGRTHAGFWIAAMLGTTHAAWSAYWALGGRFMLDTVGRWAMEIAHTRPFAALVGLMAIAVVKLLAAWIPLLAETGRVPGRRIWRVIGWIGGLVLVAYGTVNAVAAVIMLSTKPDDETVDVAGLVGHAFLWDPLFALWGAALIVALALTRDSPVEDLAP